MTLWSVGKILWLLLPAGAANMAPPLMAKLCPSWSYPLDFHRTLKGIQIFGSHKTIRGLSSGIIFGGLTFLLLKIIFPLVFPELTRVGSEFFHASPYFGFWMGFCALLADAIKSFFKRRLGIAPGQSWIPFDQIDWAIGALLGSLLFTSLSLAEIVIFLSIAFVLSAATRYAGYLFKINETPI